MKTKQRLITMVLLFKKTKILSLIFLFPIFNSTTTQAQDVSYDTINCLKIIGLAVENGKAIDGITVTLYKENEALEWDEITSVKDHEHRFLFNLLPNSYYTIEVSKEGYVNRMIGVSTLLPNDVLKTGKKYFFDFEVTMFKSMEGIDDYYLDFPVALIGYNSKTKRFEDNAKYTKHIKTKILEAENQKEKKEEPIQIMTIPK